jgi:hypothetical protein
MDLDWNRLLLEQLEWHWQHHARPRLDGLTDDEYFWEPVAGCWNVRPRGQSRAPMAVGSGDHTIDYAVPEPDPPPVTTVSWRLAHVIVGVFGQRVAGHFGGPPVYYPTFAYAGTAAEAVAQLDTVHAAWVDGVQGLGAAGLAQPCGPAEGPWSESPLAELVLHIHREAIHHLAEVALLRDLYAWRHAAAAVGTGGDGSPR